MEKELKYPLHLQLFADTEDEEDEDEILDDEDFDEDEDANGGDDEEVNVETESDDQQTEEEETKTDSKKKKKGQSQEENARQAKRRREKEQREREKIRKEAYEEGRRDGELGSIKVNPYTNKPIEDEYDLRIYKIQKGIQDAGGDPVNDLPAELAKFERERAVQKKKEAEAKTEEENKAREDVQDFAKKYPKVNPSELLKDSTFMEYAEGKLGIQSLASIYASYKKFRKTLGVVDEDEQIEKEARSKSSSPTSSSRKKGKPKSFLEMTDEEYISHEKGNKGDYF